MQGREQRDIQPDYSLTVIPVIKYPSIIFHHSSSSSCRHADHSYLGTMISKIVHVIGARDVNQNMESKAGVTGLIVHWWLA